MKFRAMIKLGILATSVVAISPKTPKFSIKTEPKTRPITPVKRPILRNIPVWPCPFKKAGTLRLPNAVYKYWCRLLIG